MRQNNIIRMPEEFSDMDSKETMLTGRGPENGGICKIGEGSEYCVKVVKNGVFFKTSTVSTYVNVANEDFLLHNTEQVLISEPVTTKSLSTSGKIIIIAAVGGLATGIADAFGAFDN